MTIIHTPAGRAGAVGAAIDRAGWPEVVGTIAGDDTVMVATAGRSQQVQLTKRLAQYSKEASND
jgi:transcriptional regulator of arginine metabolism